MIQYFKQLLFLLSFFSKKSSLQLWGGGFALAASRVCQVVAFFLPLKIFILISSQNVPAFVSQYLAFLTFDEIILLFSILVPFFYLLFIALGIAHRWLTDKHLDAMSDRLIEFSGVTIKGKKYINLHGRFSKIFSEISLIFVSTVFALALDYLVVIIWFFLIYINLFVFYHKVFFIKEEDRVTFLKLHRRQFVEYITSANFLLIFGCLVLQFMYSDIDIYVGIFLLLMSRMVFQSLNRFSLESIQLTNILPKRG